MSPASAGDPAHPYPTGRRLKNEPQLPVLLSAVPGQTVVTITNSDPVAFRTEADEKTFVRADLIVINHKETVFADRQWELLHPIQKNLLGWDRVRELAEVVSGRTPGRRHPQEIIYYKNNTGMAIQWALPASIILKRARQQGLGRELPSEWFFTDLTE